MNAQKERSENFYQTMLLVTTLAWSMSFIWSKRVTNTGMSGEVYLFIRYTLASVMLLPFAARDLKNMDRRQLRAGVILGLTFFGGMIFQTAGIALTTPSNNSFITTAYVVMAPFTTWLMTKEKPGRSIYFAALLCLFGIYVLNMKPGEALSLNLGNVLTLIGAVGWALQLSYTSIAGKYVKPVPLSFVTFVVTGLGGLCMSLVTGSLFETTAAQLAGSAEPILMAAIFPTIVGNLVQVYAQPKVNANRAAIIYSMEAVFATIISILLGMEKWTASVTIGGGIIFLAVILAQFGGKSKNEG